MIIIGAGGFAKELIEILPLDQQTSDLLFFDETRDRDSLVFLNRYPIINTWSQLRESFKKRPNFVMGVGGPLNREKLFLKCLEQGGKPKSLISEQAYVAKHDVEIGEGATILHNSTIANGTRIGKGALIYHNVQVTHDCIIGDYCELSPGATLLGKVVLGNKVQIGANASILPGVRIGNGVTVGAGAVVTKDVSEGLTVKGVPAK